MNAQKPRDFAVHLLRRRETTDEFIETLLEKELAQAPISALDRRFVQELVYGVVRWQRTLEHLIQLKSPGRSQKSGLRILLSLGLYQMFWLDRIPSHAAVFETVESAKRFGFGPQASFVNAVLRAYSREREKTLQLLANLKVDAPALGHSHPDWLYDRWRKEWGPDSAAALLRWNNTPPETCARVNRLRTNPESLAQRWAGEEVDAVSRAWTWLDGELLFLMRKHPPLADLPSFKEGWFYIQDPSTLLAVHLLRPEPGERILDLCAAPGGKTAYTAQRMANAGKVVAADSNLARLELIRENCARLGVTCVETAAPSSVGGVFDRVLVDAPCSNTGVMRRRVDLRWRITPAEIQRLRKTQLQLLDRAFLRLRRGGTLVYSTCSLEPEENGSVVEEFLQLHPGMRLQAERQLTPWADAVDGAYAAALVKLTD